MTQVTGAPSVNYALSAMILAAASITNPNYVPTQYQTFLLTVFIMLQHACISSMPTLWIARYNSYGSTLNMIGLVVVIIMIPASVTGTATTPKFLPSSQVWSIQNGTEWPDGVAVLMSFIAIIWTMSGYDAPFHLSEECSNAAVASPRAIVMTAGVGGLAGWALQLVVAYTVIDIPSVLGSDLGQPWASYLIQVMPQKIALAILGLTIVCAYSMGQGCMVAASRVTFAYARDGCFPMSWWIKRVNKHTRTPVNAVWFNTSIGICLLLLIFGGSVAIGAIFSVGAIAAYVAFTIPIFIKTFFVGDRFRRGPWHLGKFSKPIGMMACAFILVMMPILCFPAYRGKDNTAQLMNWTIVVYGGPMTCVLIWWFVSARKWFKGPKINVEVSILLFPQETRSSTNWLMGTNSIICLAGKRIPSMVSRPRIAIRAQRIARKRRWKERLCLLLKSGNFQGRCGLLVELDIFFMFLVLYIVNDQSLTRARMKIPCCLFRELQNHQPENKPCSHH
jgi:amino acid transporter